MITAIEKNIIKKWNELVLSDVQNRPITDEDLAGLNEDVVNMLREGRRLQKIYGCTLIMTCILDDFWFGIQVGDGKCVSISEKGLYSQPIPWDNEGCVGNRSTSICDSKAFDSFRYAYGPDVPVASFVASDGVDESFDENGLNKCYYSLSAWAKTLSEEELESNFTQLLTQISNGGSGDDVSISGIVSIPREVRKPVATSEQVATKMEEILGVVREIEGRYVELRDKDSEINDEISAMEKSIQELEKEIADKRQAIDDKTAERDSVRKNYISISEQYREMTDQLNFAKDRKKQVDDYWRGLGVEVTDTTAIENYKPLKIEVREAFGDKKADEASVNPPEAQQEKESAPAPVQEAQPQVQGTPQQPQNIPPIQQNIPPVPQQNMGIVLTDKEPANTGTQEGNKKSGFFGNLFRKG